VEKKEDASFRFYPCLLFSSSKRIEYQNGSTLSRYSLSSIPAASAGTGLPLRRSAPEAHTVAYACQDAKTIAILEVRLAATNRA